VKKEAEGLKNVMDMIILMDVLRDTELATSTEAFQSRENLSQLMVEVHNESGLDQWNTFMLVEAIRESQNQIEKTLLERFNTPLTDEERQLIKLRHIEGSKLDIIAPVRGLTSEIIERRESQQIRNAILAESQRKTS
jgi:hypothetical protein